MAQDDIVLGHSISKNGIYVDKAKIEVIEKKGVPTDIKEVRSFLGCVGYYRWFVPNLSKVAVPLCRLLQKYVEFVFDEDYLKSFEALKKALISAPIVKPPDWNKLFELMCDASDRQISVVLGQSIENKLYVIHYASRILNDA